MEFFNQANWGLGNYFEQDRYYRDSNGQNVEIDEMHPVHARRAFKKYRAMFPKHVKHLNRTVLGRRLRRRYIYAYIIIERGSRV